MLANFLKCNFQINNVSGVYILQNTYPLPLGGILSFREKICKGRKKGENLTEKGRKGKEKRQKEKKMRKGGVKGKINAKY